MSILEYIDYRNGLLWVTEEFLSENLPWAPWSISINTIRNGTRKYRKHQSDRWENHSHIKLGRKVLINWDSIDFETLHPFKTRGLNFAPWNGDPDAGKKTLINLIQTERESSRQEKQAGLIDTLDQVWTQAPYFKAADEWYFQSKYQVNRQAGDIRANHLAQSVAILRMLQSGQLFGFSSRKDLQEAIAQRVKELDIYGTGLKSYDRLRKTETAYKKAVADPAQDARDVVMNGNQGNQKRLKFDDLHRTTAMRYYLGLVHQQKPDKLAAWRDYYNHMITEGGCNPSEVIRYSRFKQITMEKRVEDLAAAIRHGGSFYDCFVRPYVYRDELPHSNTLIFGDGWEPGRSVAFSWRNPKTGRIEDRTGTMNVWLWYDGKSKAIISHHIAPFENSYQVRTSFRDIVGLWGVCPRSIMVDHRWTVQPDTKRMWEKADVFIQDKKAYSPWTNLAERNNKESNKIHRYLDEFWVNMTHNHTPQSQHNEEKLRGGKSKFFDEPQPSAKPMKEEDFRALVYKIIEIYNHTPLRSLGDRTPMEVYLENLDPQCRKMDPLELVWIFGEKVVSTVHNYAVDIAIASKKHTFLIKPEDMIKYQRISPKYGKVRVYYDERHLESADIYAMVNENDESGDSYICTAMNKNLVKVSGSTLVNREDPDYQQKQAFQSARGHKLDQIIKEELKYMDEIDETMGWDTASYMTTSQEKYKEMHSNAVAQQYRKYHQAREEQEGHLVKLEEIEAPVEVISKQEKYRIYKNRMNNKE